MSRRRERGMETLQVEKMVEMMRILWIAVNSIELSRGLGLE